MCGWMNGADYCFCVQHEQQGTSASQGTKRNPYKMYSDTIKVIRLEPAHPSSAAIIIFHAGIVRIWLESASPC